MSTAGSNGYVLIHSIRCGIQELLALVVSIRRSAVFLSRSAVYLFYGAVGMHLQNSTYQTMTLCKTPDELGKTARSELEAELTGDESFVVGAQTTGSPFRRFRCRLVLTTDRLIVIDPGLFKSNVRSISLSNISSVNTDRLSAVGRVRLRGPGDLDESFYIHIDDGERIAKALRDQLTEKETTR